MTALDGVKLRLAPLSKRIVFARFGKNPEVALETKDAMSDVLQVFTQYAFDGEMPEIGQCVELQFGAGDEQFLVLIERVSK